MAGKGDFMFNEEISVARGIQKAELVLKNANIINVFTEDIEHADVAIHNGLIVGIGAYQGIEEIDCTGKFVAPGFIDGHIHLESSMLKPIQFAKAVLPHGTTAVITDPHEITNVCGTDGIEYMMEASEGLPIDIYFMLPSCVPATPFDESGCALLAKDLNYLYHKKNVLGLAEVMDFIGTINGDKEILQKIADAFSYQKQVDGHAPGLHGKELCAYITAGIHSDHECTNIEEAKEKIKLGQWVMIREGTAAKNMDSLMDLFQAPYHQRTMLVTDDKHPYDIIQNGHIDYMIRKAIAKGADPCIAIKMATLNTAMYFGLKNTGAIAPGYRADIVIFSDLKEIKIEKVIKNGKIVVNLQSLVNSQGIINSISLVNIDEPRIKNELLNKIYHSFHCKEIIAEDFLLKLDEDCKEVGENCKGIDADCKGVNVNCKGVNANCKGLDADCKGLGLGSFRVIQMIKGEILTKEISAPLENGKPTISTQKDIIKLAVIERHHQTNHIGIGFVKGYGLKEGAIASSVAHDSHNLIVIGTNENDMAVAANCIREMQGGWVIVVNGEIREKLTLPIGGLMSELDAVSLAKSMEEMKEIARSLGVEEGIDPFMSLAFVSLPVIPELRLITTGLIDVRTQRVVSIIV